MENRVKNKEELSEKTELIVGSVLGLAYFLDIASVVVFIFFGLLVSALGADPYSDIVLVSSQMISAIIILYLYFAMKKDLFYDTVKDYKKPDTYTKALLYFGCFYGALIVYNIIMMIAGITELTNNNQEGIDALLKTYPAVMILFVVIVAPLIEEFVCRYFFFNLLARKNVKLAIMVVTSFFAIIHLISSFSVVGDLAAAAKEYIIYIKISSNYLVITRSALLTLPIYLISGFILTYCYAREKRIAIPILIHVVINLISVVA